MAEDSIKLPVTCDDCGNRFEVPIAGVELETLDIVCPACGRSDRLTDNQIETIIAQVEAARTVAVEYARESLGKAIGRATRGSKHIKYRPKR